MSSCCCSLAGTAACQKCANNPYATRADGVMAVVSHLRTYVGPQTNYDRLVSKTPEELAEWLVAIINHAESDNCGKSCPLYSYCIESNGGMLDWLKAPADEVDE